MLYLLKFSIDPLKIGPGKLSSGSKIETAGSCIRPVLFHMEESRLYIKVSLMDSVES